MALPFVVANGTGLTNATSYVSTLEADDYLDIKPNSTSWGALAETTKEEYVAWATRLLDQRTYWRGCKAVDASALRWPRINVVDRDGLAIDSSIIPSQVKAATIEIAYHLLSQSVDPSAPLASSSGDIKRVKADVVEIEYVEGTATNALNLFPIGINDILEGLGTLRNSQGSGFGRIVRV